MHCIVTVVTLQSCASNSQCLQEDLGHPRAYASVYSFVAPLALDGSSLQCWMEVATWCRVQASAASADCRVSTNLASYLLAH